MTDALTIRNARATDAARVWQLAGALDGLEQNTCYAYVLGCTHFAATTLVAERTGAIVGYVLAYAPPGRADTVFVWQVGVAPEVGGRGVGGRLLDELWARCGARYLEATVAPSNEASQRLFRGFARRRGAPCEVGPGFSADLFQPTTHEPEHLFRIGPLTP